MIAAALAAAVLAASPDAELNVVGIRGEGVGFEDLQRFLSARAYALSTCFTGNAKARLAFSITPPGRTADVTVDAPAQSAACVTTLVQGWTFPFRPATDAKVEVAMVFRESPRLVFPLPTPEAPPTPGGILLSAPKVEGDAFPVEQFERYVNSRKAALLGCYEKELKREAGLAGKATLTFLVTPLGRPQEVAVETSLEAVGACVKTIVRGWVFPWKPERDVRVAITLTFARAK